MWCCDACRDAVFDKRDSKFESGSLQQTVRLSREIARRGREPRLFARVCEP